MSAVIRIKRHITEEPQEAFVLNCKKRKTDDSTDSQSNSNETSTVLKFAGTVHQDTNINEHIAKITKDEAREIVSRKKTNESRLQSRRDDHRQKSQQNRFKIVNFTRGNNDQENETSTDSQPLTIVDVEKDRITPEASTSSAGAATEGASTSFSDISDDPYVYDIYIAENSNALHQDSIDMNDLSILEYNDYLYSRARLENSDDESDDNEDEDSNDENNWRNDYPDEDEDVESIGERDMRRAMDDLDFGLELSSDDGNENGFVYSVDAEGFNFEDDLDFGDENRYGEAYARYKRRVVKEMADNDRDDDEESIDDDFIDSD